MQLVTQYSININKLNVILSEHNVKVTNFSSAKLAKILSNNSDAITKIKNIASSSIISRYTKYLFLYTTFKKCGFNIKDADEWANYLLKHSKTQNYLNEFMDIFTSEIERI